MAKEYIEREVLLKNLNRFAQDNYCVTINDVIMNLPAADVAEVVHGRWIDILSREIYIPDEKTTITLTEEKCSNCNVVAIFKGEKIYLPDYVCPNCGAKMDGGEENAAD